MLALDAVLVVFTLFCWVVIHCVNKLVWMRGSLICLIECEMADGNYARAPKVTGIICYRNLTARTDPANHIGLVASDGDGRQVSNMIVIARVSMK